MKQKGIKLHSLIIKVLSDEERNKINEIKTNIEAKPVKIYRQFGTEKVLWDSMRRLLNPDTKDHQSQRWIVDQVINFYFKIKLAEMDQKRCQAEPGQNRSDVLCLYFWQALISEQDKDMTVRRKYNYKTVSRWSRKLPGGDIFNLRQIFTPINKKNQH
jgi:Ulp1 family protease